MRSITGPHLIILLGCCSLIGAMDVPERMQASTVDQQRIQLSWESLSGVDAIAVLRSRDGGHWTTIADLGGSATSHLDQGLSTDTLYLYRLQVSDGSTTALGNLHAARTTRLVAAGDAPTRIYAYYHPEGGIRIRWLDRYADETGYRLQRNVDGGSFSDVATLPADSDSYTDTALPTGTITYRLRAERNATSSDWISTKVGNSAPSSNWYDGSTPYFAGVLYDPSLPQTTGLTASRIGPSTVDISWDAPTGITEFTVLRALPGSEFQTLKTVTGTSYRLAGVFIDHQQRISVVSRNGTDYGPPSSPITIAPISHDPLLIPPQNLQAVEDGDDILLSWDDSDNETGYVIERLNAADNHPDMPDYLATLPADTTSFRHVGASSFNDYRVWARSVAGWSEPSPGASVPRNYGTAMPINLRTTNLTPTKVELAWDVDGTYYYHARIERRDSDGVWRQCNLVKEGASETTYIDSDVVPGTTYRYRIAFLYPVRTSAILTVAVPQPGSPPDAVGSLSASAAGADQINLSWSLAGSATTSVRVERRPSGGSYQQIATIDRAATRFSDTGLAANTAYDYRVTAGNAAGDAAARTASATTGSGSLSWSTNTRTGAEAGLKTLEVHCSAANDDCEIRQVGDRIDIYRDGSLWQSENGPYAVVKVHGKAGDDQLRVHGSTTVRTLLYGQDGDDRLVCDGAGWQAAVAIGHGFDTVAGSASTATYWVDSPTNDTVETGAAGTAQRVSAFFGQRSKELKGQDWKEPGNYEFYSDTRYPSTPLWGDGPGLMDINQGTFQDCPVTSLGQLEIWTIPDAVQHSAVDLGDETYAVQVDGGFHRMDEDVAAGTVSILPPSGRQWWLILEKAYYINGFSFPKDTNETGGEERVFNRRYHDAGEHYYRWARSTLAAGGGAISFTRRLEVDYQEITSPGQHAHTLIGCFRDDAGKPHFVLRNPYGLHYEYSYGLIDPQQGLRVVDFPQFLHAFAPGGLGTRDKSGVPVAEDMQLTMQAGESIGLALMGYDQESRSLSWEILDTPSRGTLDGVAPWLRFHDDGTTAGTIAIRYRVSAGGLTSDTATVTITIDGDDPPPPTNQAPVITASASADPATVTGTSTQLRVSATDPDGDDLSYTWELTAQPAGSGPSFAASQRQPVVTFDQVGSYTFAVSVSDGSLTTAGGSVVVTVAATASEIDISSE